MARKGENIYRRKDGRWEGRYAQDWRRQEPHPLGNGRCRGPVGLDDSYHDKSEQSKKVLMRAFALAALWNRPARQFQQPTGQETIFEGYFFTRPYGQRRSRIAPLAARIWGTISNPILTLPAGGVYLSR